jgi:hypothetical protein
VKCDVWWLWCVTHLNHHTPHFTDSTTTTHTRLHSAVHHHTQSVVLAHRISTTMSPSAAAPCSRCWTVWRGVVRWPSMRCTSRSRLAMPSRARSDVSTIVPGSSTRSSTSDDRWAAQLCRWLTAAAAAFTALSLVDSGGLHSLLCVCSFVAG